MHSKICEWIEIEYPIFQGGMAWIADASLAGAVSNAGGLGIIAGGNAPKAAVREEIEKIKKMTSKPFGVNIMLLSPYAEEIVDLVCEEKVKVVTTGAGNPGKYMERFKKAGIKVIPVVPSVGLGRRMEKIGADAVIAEGMESGGHIGKLTTMSLVPQVVSALKIPVIAAGGIGDGRGMAAAVMLGAQGVQLGTRFLVATECSAHPNYKEKIIHAKDIDTTICSEYLGHAVRVVKNKLTRQYHQLESAELKKVQPDLLALEKLGKDCLRKAVVDGDSEYGSVMAGQIAGMLEKEESCEEIIQTMVAEMKQTIMEKATQYL